MVLHTHVAPVHCALVSHTMLDAVLSLGDAAHPGERRSRRVRRTAAFLCGRARRHTPKVAGLEGVAVEAGGGKAGGARAAPALDEEGQLVHAVCSRRGRRRFRSFSPPTRPRTLVERPPTWPLLARTLAVMASRSDGRGLHGRQGRVQSRCAGCGSASITAAADANVRVPGCSYA